MTKELTRYLSDLSEKRPEYAQTANKLKGVIQTLVDQGRLPEAHGCEVNLHTEKELCNEVLCSHRAEKVLHIKGKEVQLTDLESKIMTLLMQNEETPVSTLELKMFVYGSEYATDLSIRTHIFRLRKKINTVDPALEPIKTVKKYGYKYSITPKSDISSDNV